ALMSSDCAVRAYQFSTLRQKAFQLKPRAAFACSIGSESEQKIVAYGLDGTVQVWNPHTQISEVALVRDDLGIEHVEDMTQLNSHILAGVPKPGASIKTQRWMQSPHEGQISVILGMPRLRQGHSSKAFLLTGGTRDKEVYLWSVETNGAHVTKMLATRKMYAGHTSRITALCHEPVGNNAISGSASGRISVNDMESGKLIATSGQPSQLTIGSTVLCPTNTNILMTTCVSRREQVRIFDLRKGISWAKPAIVLGIDTPRTQSRYSRPAWHPDGGLVVYPYRGGTVVQVDAEDPPNVPLPDRALKTHVTQTSKPASLDTATIPSRDGDNYSMGDFTPMHLVFTKFHPKDELPEKGVKYQYTSNNAKYILHATRYPAALP
ncbi:hypothetical protein GGF38_001612, partial [Coemansia sp. RSA 25]